MPTTPEAKRQRTDLTGYNSSWKDGGYSGLKAGDDIKTWAKKHADITEDHVYIDGHPVMEGWEQPYMARLAEEACSKGGKVLEVGFGMALSATAIQKHDIKEHVIIEASEEVFKKLQEWAKKQPHKVTPMLGLWQDVVSTLPDSSFDGILYDTFPNNKEHQHTHQFEFIQQARRIMKPGGVLTYCNLTSLGVLRPQFQKEGQSDLQCWQNLFENTQVPHLLKCGFKKDEIKPIALHSGLKPPPTCAYYQHSSQLVPHVEKH
eukprot:TRINITY_DN385_c0_g1_i2.p1 TRINITY_DN385_c0_g1~~TRINITY_DN385_c0_g1_i2.p1  ORF type:complete len:261 (+),score=120.56 TRINITY_DN385_c0_g1_i2:64-846(+)